MMMRMKIGSIRGESNIYKENEKLAVTKKTTVGHLIFWLLELCNIRYDSNDGKDSQRSKNRLFNTNFRVCFSFSLILYLMHFRI